MAQSTNTPSDSNVTNPPAPTSEAPAVEATEEIKSDKPVAMSKIKGVKYTGHATVRSISKDEFKIAGVDAPQDLVWDKSNGYVVDDSSINAAVRDHLVRDGEFELVTD